MKETFVILQFGKSNKMTCPALPVINHYDRQLIK